MIVQINRNCNVSIYRFEKGETRKVTADIGKKLIEREHGVEVEEMPTAEPETTEEVETPAKAEKPTKATRSKSTPKAEAKTAEPEAGTDDAETAQE